MAKMKKGTTGGTAKSMADQSRGAYHGPGNKNVQSTAKPAGRPKGPTDPIKGMDRGGV